MSFTKCAAAIKKAMASRGNIIDSEEFKKLDKEFVRLLRYEQHTNPSATQIQQAKDALDKYKKMLDRDKAYSKLKKLRQLHLDKSNMNKITEHYRDNLVEGLRSVTISSYSRAAGAKKSAGTITQGLADRWTAELDRRLGRKNVKRLFRDGEFEDEVMDVMEAIASKQDTSRFSADAKDVGQSIYDVQKKMRKKLIQLGVPPIELDGWFMTQYHDTWRIGGHDSIAWARELKKHGKIRRKKIRQKEARNEWVTDMKNWVDETKLYLDVGLDPSDRKAVDLWWGDQWKSHATGAFMRAETGAVGGAKSMTSIATAHRVYTFRPGKWKEYNKKYGSGSRGGVTHGPRHNILSSVTQNIIRSSRLAGILTSIGDRPKADMQRLINNVENWVREEVRAGRMDDMDATEQLRRLNKYRGMPDSSLSSPMMNEINTLDGSIDVPHHWGLSRWLSIMRQITRMAKMGGSVITQFSDINPYAANMMRTQNIGFMEAITEPLKGIRNVKMTPEVRAHLSYTGIYNRAAYSNMAAARVSMGADGEGGALSRIHQRFFNWNLMAPVTEATRASSGLGNTGRMAVWAESDWVDLPKDVQANLRLYDINKAEWNAMRHAPIIEADGYKFFSAENIAELDKKHIENYLRQKRRKVTDKNIEKAREQFMDDLSMYYVDQASMSVLEPTVHEKAVMFMGQQRGTVVGDLFWRSALELKAFPITFMMRSMGPEWRYQTAGKVGAAAVASGVMGLVRLYIMMTVTGYISNTISDLMKGRKPFIPDTDNPEHIWKAWMAASARGGGLSILGDFLFGEANRYGGGIAATLMGPTIGGFGSDVTDLLYRLRDGDPIAGKALNTLINTTPYGNLFYTRWLLDYLILYELTEMANPGWAKRHEKRLWREKGQEYFDWRAPTEIVR
jgi:hypothetical protein